MGKPSDGRDLGSRLDRFIYRLLCGAPFRRDTDAIDPREWLLRRIPHAYLDRSASPPVSRAAFRPNSTDTDGISLFREMFLSPKRLSATGKKAPFLVVRLRASDVVGLGLSLDASPDSKQPPGHSHVPELTDAEMKRDKEQSKTYQFGLQFCCNVAYCPKILGDGTTLTTKTRNMCLAAA